MRHDSLRTRAVLLLVAAAAAAAALAGVLLWRRGEPRFPPGPCEVRALAGELAEADVSGEHLRYGADLPAEKTRYAGGVHLRSIVACPSQRIVFRRPLERARRLEVELSLLLAAAEGETSPVTFRALAVGPRGEKVLLERTLHSERDTDLWQRCSVDLAGMNLDGARLVLVTEPGAVSGRGFPTRYPVWGSPVLVSGGRSTRPNVVLVVLEGLRADSLGCTGGRPGVSPSIDALAARGLLADCVIAPSPAPEIAMRSLLSGLAPGALAMCDPDDAVRIRRYFGAPKLPGLMRRSGALTAAFTGGYLGMTPEFDSITETRENFQRERSDPSGAELLAGRAAEWIAAHRDEPFFMLFHSTEAGPPWTDTRYAAGPPPGWSQAGFGLADGPEAREGYNPSPADIAYARALYDGDVASVDAAVGMLVESLRSAGVLDRTVVAVASIAPSEIFDHDWWGSGFGMFQEHIRVPLVAAGPGIGPRRLALPLRLERVAPELLRAGGVDAALGGRKASPLPAEGKSVIVTGWPLGGEWRWAVRAGRWHLIAGGKDLERRCLYDLSSDPTEKTDLAPAKAAVAAVLADEIRRYVEWSSHSARADFGDGEKLEYEPSAAARALAAGGGPER